MLEHVIEEGLSIELLRPAHAPELFALVDANREHLRRWLPWVDRTREVSDTAAFIQGCLESLAAGKGLEFGIWWDARIAGVIGLFGTDSPNRSAAIGYWLSKAAEGRGIVSKACPVVLRYAFGELGLHRVQICCAQDNRRSQGIPERLGFVREGILRGAERIGDTYADLVVFGLLAEEWKARNTGT